MDKAPDAFRTISEVAEDLDVPQHVLRFWETRFGQIKPLKRGGGRRYYRPDDVDLLRGIRHLLYGEGYTIRGVQRILKDNGLKFVQAVWTAQAPAKEPAQRGSSASHDAEGDFEPAEINGEVFADAALGGHRQRPDDIRVGRARAAHTNFAATRDQGSRTLHAAPAQDRHAGEYATIADGITDDDVLDQDTIEDDAAQGDEFAADRSGVMPAAAPGSGDAPAGRPVGDAGSLARRFMHLPEGVEAHRPAPAHPLVPQAPSEPAEEQAAAAPLSPDDRRRLQATLSELDECRRILEAALNDPD